ncbi:hypothetical protein F751_2156 [Auxenochlorella protothecoides]|uniref:Uncharacterized protein n=1 Tax=Auxenochlorella protothecoides TaxID=3075 RepID=A0A087SLG5_AUXPR|nr:hypothetical protein F751_2156 [Auxenochlorella protothecoides]KFM26569.1 hypothetical protein F751_2156 [Auxenochlorella protothecoides]
MQEYLDRMKTVLAEIEAEQPPHSPSLPGSANLSASLSTLTSDLEALSGHWASTPRGDRGPKAQRLSHYQVWVKSPDTQRARRRTFPGSLGESTPRHLLEEADPARAGHASEADGRDGLPGGSGGTPCKAAPASIQEAAGMPAAAATSGLQGTALLVEAVALSTITETELTGETRLPQTGTGGLEVESMSAWEAAGSPDVGTAILDDLGGHHDQEPAPVDQQAAASREESPSASASTAPEAAFTDADTASSGEESAPGSAAAGIAVLQELSRDLAAGAPGPAVEPEPHAELPSGCPTPVDRIDLISPPVFLTCLPQPGPTSTPEEAGPGQTGSPNQHNPNITGAGSTERDGVLSEGSSGGSSGADGAEDVGPRPSPPCSQQPPLQAPPQQRLQALSRLKQRAAARHTSVLSSAQRPVLLTDAGTQILGTPSASWPTVAAKPFLKRRTSAVQSQRLDWSGVGPRTTTKLDPNLILDRTPGK